MVIKAGKASASYLQRRLRVGYARAARLIDLLEDAGIVGPADGSRPREILVSMDQMEDEDRTPTVFKQNDPDEEEPQDDDDVEEADDIFSDDDDEQDEAYDEDEGDEEDDE